MKKMSWQRGLFRIYLLLAAVGLVTLAITIPKLIDAYKYRKKSRELSTAETAVYSYHSAFARAFPKLEFINYESGKSGFENHLKAINRGVEKGQITLSSKAEIQLEKYSVLVDAMGFCTADIYYQLYINERERADALLWFGCSAIFAPWVLHYFLKLAIIPILKWIAKGFFGNSK